LYQVNLCIYQHLHLAGTYDLNDEAILAKAAFEQTQTSGLSLEDELQNTQGGRNLIKLGYTHDVKLVARENTLEILPELNIETNTITI